MDFFRPQDFMPKGQFYALAIFVMGRLDTKGVGLKLWGRRRACSQDYPIAVEAQGRVASNGSVELLIPYKYIYLFDVPHTARITLEGQDEDTAPFVCPITSHNDKLLVVGENHYFTAKTNIRSNGSNDQPGLKVSARIVISDKTLWQQVFRK